MVVTFFLYIYCYSSSIPKYIMSSFIEKIFFYHQLSHFYFGPNDPSKWEKTKQKKKKKKPDPISIPRLKLSLCWIFYLYVCICIVAFIIYGHEKENKIISFTTTLPLFLYILLSGKLKFWLYNDKSLWFASLHIISSFCIIIIIPLWWKQQC